MLIGLVSDPHANFHALEAVLADIDRVRPDVLLCLGDFVGYGAFPNEVVFALRERCAISLAGNHDLCVLGHPAAPIESMNNVAAAAITWTRNELGEDARLFLMSLSSSGVTEDFEVFHASPRDPVSEYVIDAAVAYANFVEATFKCAIVGHTHIPALWSMDGQEIVGGRIVSHSDRTPVEVPLGRLILNPGSVGQPRDGDPRATWATFDSESRVFTIRRVEYPVRAAQDSIRDRGLPEFLAERLAIGI